MFYELFSIGELPTLKIDIIGCSADPEQTRFGKAQRDNYTVHYVLSGRGYFNGNPVSAGQGFFVTPGMIEEYYPDMSDPWEYIWFTSRDAAMARFFELYNADRDTNIFSYQNISVLKNTESRVILQNGSLISAAQMLEMYLHVFNNHTSLKTASLSSPADLYFDFSVNYIKNNLYSQVTVKRLTELLGISQPYLYKIFKQKTGISPKQYIDDYRLLQAKILLCETDMTITEIARSVGMPDVLSFSKFFAAKEKVSPKAYRQSK